MKRKVLLIDDDQDLLRSFHINLEIIGYEVTTASDSEEGLKSLKNDKPDIIILDVMMNTNLEGYNFLHKIKEDSEYKTIPVLLLTGMADQIGVNLYSAVEDVKALPNVRFQDKPIPPIKLVEIIEDMIRE
jgi:CheY-like chemotaxis protein